GARLVPLLEGSAATLALRHVPGRFLRVRRREVLQGELHVGLACAFAVAVPDGREGHQQPPDGEEDEPSGELGESGGEHGQDEFPPSCSPGPRRGRGPSVPPSRRSFFASSRSNRLASEMPIAAAARGTLAAWTRTTPTRKCPAKGALPPSARSAWRSGS